MSGTNSLIVGATGEGVSSFNGFYAVAGHTYNNVTTESFTSSTFQAAATFSHFGINTATQFISATYTLRVNGLNGTQTVTSAMGANGFISDATHSDGAVAGNTLDFSAQVGQGRAWVMQANSSTPLTWYGTGVAASTGATLSSTVCYCNLQGSTIGTVTGWNDSTQSRVESPGTLSNMGMMVITAPTGAVSVHAYINGSNGNQALSFSSGTGYKQDVTHTDSIVSGQDCGTSFSSANSSGVWMGIQYLFAGITSSHECGTSRDSSSQGAGVYFNTGGIFFWGSNTESEIVTALPFSLTASHLRLRTFAGNFNTGTATIRIAGANGNNTVSFVLQTGLMVDTTHTDAVTVGQNVDYNISNVGPWSSMFISGDDGSADDVTGVGAIALNIAVAGIGTAVTPSIGAVALNIAVAGGGVTIEDTVGAIGLNIAVAGSGTGVQANAGAIGLHIDVSGVPKYTFPAAGAIGINIAVAGAGVNAAISPGGGDVPLDQKDWKRRYGRWKEIEEELIAAEEARRGKIRAGVVDAYERSVEGKTDPEPETEPEPFKLPAITRQYSAQELGPLLKYGSIRKHSTSNHDEQDDEEAILHL